MKLSIFCCILSCSFIFYSCKKNTGTGTQQHANNKPNIIFILGDDVGYEIPTCNGGTSYSTPNIDKLASEGMRFTQCRSAPLCSPSRFMILTGKYNFRNYTTWGKMDLGQRTIGNLLKDAGYVTCYAGKWQLDGGDKSIKTFGFDNYSVWLPFYQCPEGIRYKSAPIYENGNFLPQSQTDNKYSEDHFTDYILNFIDSNKSNAFFIYYSMILCHKEFSPTPDDAGYAAWQSIEGNNDKKYFPSMVKYMDKKIGIILDKIKSAGLEKNTIVFYVGDNGTQKEITSGYLNDSITGAKSESLEYGIHVPLICKWPDVIAPGKVNNDIVDFTDILPTMADIADISVLQKYKPVDGFSFYKALNDVNNDARSWSFCHYYPRMCGKYIGLERWAQDTAYKLYETGNFYHFTNDIMQEHPLTNASLTEQQAQIKQSLQDVINSMHN
jgi:arylsulfatase A